MKFGVTGTRSGMTSKQQREFKFTLATMLSPDDEFHHGDCVGVDLEAAEIAQSMGCTTICHPPLDERLRAHHKSDIILEQKNHFARNRSIVDSVDLLFVLPYQDEWQSRGGTWYTHDYAKKKGVEIFMIWPKKQGR